MKKKLMMCCLFVVVLAMGLSSMASATTAFYEDFEGMAPTVNPYWTQFGTAWIPGGTPSVEQWYYAGVTGIYNSPGGNDVLFSNGGGFTYYVGQIAGGRTYTLSALVGDVNPGVDSSNGGSDYTLALYASNGSGPATLLASTSGTAYEGLQLASVQWDVTGYEGYNLGLHLRGSGIQVNFDNVKLTNDTNGTHAPEPATMLLLGSGLMGLVGVRRKFRK